MGVHDTENYAQVKKLLGIPGDEPIFILRAQDTIAATIIETYRVLYNVIAQAAGIDYSIRRYFSDHLQSCYANFQQYAAKYPDRIKVPD